MTAVPFRLEGDAVVILGSVNGQPVEFVLDTGDAVGPVFTPADAARLGLAQGAAQSVEGAGGAAPVYQTVASVSFGHRVWAAEPSAVDPGLAGYSLLGLPFFVRETAGLLFDFRGLSLTLIGQ